MASDHAAHRLIGFNGKSHVALEQLAQPHDVLDIKGLIQPQRSLLGSHRCLGNTRSLHHFQGASRKTHDGIINNSDPNQGWKGYQKPLYNIFCHISQLPPALHGYMIQDGCCPLRQALVPSWPPNTPGCAWGIWDKKDIPLPAPAGFPPPLQSLPLPAVSWSLGQPGALHQTALWNKGGGDGQTVPCCQPVQQSGPDT